MKKICFVFALCFSFMLNAQQFQTVEEVNIACPPNLGFMGNEEALSSVDQIMDQLGLPRNFEIQECYKTANAQAKILKDDEGKNRSFILYNAKFFERITSKTNTDWSAIFILAHEIGHLLSQHALNNDGSNPGWEIEADYFAGKSLAQMGSTLEEAQSAVATTPERGSTTHPPRVERMDAVQRAWDKFANPNLKNVTINENTPASEITSEKVLDRYFEALGGVEAVNKIKTLDYKEKIIEVYEDGWGQPQSYVLEYHQVSPTEVYIYNLDLDEEYKISNDSLYHRYKKKSKWKLGAPNGEDNHVFKNNIYSSTGNFVEDFILLSNPDIANFNVKKEYKGVMCFELVTPSKEEFIGDKNKKGLHVIIETSRLYSVTTGLLHAIIDKKTEHIYKRGVIQETTVMTTEKSLDDFYVEGNVTFPHKYSRKVSIATNNIIENEEEQIREVFDIVINPK